MIAVQVQTGPRTAPLTYYAPDDIAVGDSVIVPVLATVIAIGSETSEATREILQVVATPSDVAGG